MERGTWTVKTGLAQMLKGGVIMDVVTPEQARIAEDAGACAVMALERVPADIRADGVFVGSGIFKSENPAARAQAIVRAVTHFQDAKILADVSRGIGDAMPGLEIGALRQEELLAGRGW